MINFLKLLIGFPDSDVARLIFRSIVNQKTRIDVMQSLLQTSRLNASRSEECDRALEEFRSLNGMRNDYVHGIWVRNDIKGQILLSQGRGDDLSLLEGRPVFLKELDDVIQRMQELQHSIRRVYATELQQDILRRQGVGATAKRK